MYLGTDFVVLLVVYGFDFGFGEQSVGEFLVYFDSLFVVHHVDVGFFEGYLDVALMVYLVVGDFVEGFLGSLFVAYLVDIVEGYLGSFLMVHPVAYFGEGFLGGSFVAYLVFVVYLVECFLGSSFGAHLVVLVDLVEVFLRRSFVAHLVVFTIISLVGIVHFGKGQCMKCFGACISLVMGYHLVGPLGFSPCFSLCYVMTCFWMCFLDIGVPHMLVQFGMIA